MKAFLCLPPSIPCNSTYASVSSPFVVKRRNPLNTGAAMRRGGEEVNKPTESRRGQYKTLIRRKHCSCRGINRKQLVGERSRKQLPHVRNFCPRPVCAANLYSNITGTGDLAATNAGSRCMFVRGCCRKGLFQSTPPGLFPRIANAALASLFVNRREHSILWLSRQLRNELFGQLNNSYTNALLNRRWYLCI